MEYVVFSFFTFNCYFIRGLWYRFPFTVLLWTTYVAKNINRIFLIRLTWCEIGDIWYGCVISGGCTLFFRNYFDLSRRYRPNNLVINFRERQVTLVGSYVTNTWTFSFIAMSISSNNTVYDHPPLNVSESHNSCCYRTLPWPIQNARLTYPTCVKIHSIWYNLQ